MIEHVMWKRSLAALGACLLLGLGACSSSDGDGDAKDGQPSSDSTASDDMSDQTDDESSEASEPQTTSDPTKDGGFKFLPECDEFARSIVDGEDVADQDQVDGRSCRFTIGEERVVGRQNVWIARGGGSWPKKFKADELNEMLAGAADPGDKKYESSVSEIDVPRGWAYGLRFDEKIGVVERSSYRLLAYAENGDLLICHTSVSDADLDAFRTWCDDVLEAVQP